MVSSSPSQAASSASLGRERALEVLMDRDPLGSYYRAARAVEEVVPNAFASRPNLVTKAALVEQAFSLSKFDIDRLSKYDSAFSETSTEKPPDNIMVDTLARERILNHHHKLVEAQSKEPASILSTPAKADKDKQDELSVPPASAALVAILRQIFDEKNTEDDSSSLFDLRHLLEAVTSHSVLGNAKTDYKQHLECILATLCRTHASEDHPHFVQGLLLAVLSLLTPQEEESLTVVEPPNPKVPQDVKMARMRPDNNKEDHQQPDEPRPPVLLQVASLLHLFPLETRKEDEPYESFMLDPKLMEYFGTAAAAAEERLEFKRTLNLQKEQEQKQTEVVLTTPKASPKAATKPPEEEPTTAALAPEEALQEAFEQFVSTMAQAAVSDAPLESLEQFVSSMTRAEEVPLDEEEHGDYPQLLERHDENDVDDDDDEESSSSESSASESSEFSSEEDEEEANAAVVSDGNETDAEVDAVLSEALAMRDQTTETDDDEDVNEVNLVEEASPPYVVTADHADKDEPSEQSVSPETPVSKSASEDHHVVDTHSSAEERSEIEEDDSNLPPLPPQPSEYPFRSFLGKSGSDHSDADPTVGFFDPNDAPRFASLPASHLLVHLLRYAVMTMEQRRLTPRPNAEEPITTVPGGMGAALFPQKLPPRCGSDEKEKKDVLTLQLLVAALLVLNEKRDEALESLRKAVAREQRCAVRADEGDSIHADDTSEVPLESEGEEDDPAMALALNYVEDDVPLSSEALENKGMKRKAAAAAYDTEALLKTLRRQVVEWKSSVTLYSYCVTRALRLLRYLMQTLVRRTFVDDARAGDDIDNGLLPALECHSYLTRNVSERLSTALSSLTMQIVRGERIAGLEDEKEAERVFLRFILYKEAVSAWRECIPLFHPSPDSMVDLLKSQVASCSFTYEAELSPLFQSVDCLSVPPSSEDEIELHKLQLLCRRFRVSDILGALVPTPVPYLSQDDDGGDGSGGSKGGDETMFRDQRDPHRVSILISMVGNFLQKLPKAGSELEYFYLALCHRCHSRVLLLDGLYATTMTATEEASFSTFSSKAASTSDIVRISTNPSKTLVFDATKCADSIAMLSDSGSGGGNGPSVNQRASKVWGTVLSTRHYSPKTGTHRWAVRLDKCERGHIFIGVATAQASMRTYVGGDKYGWGMIGTQALWHDRRKIRGDYGATLRSGATVIVTLDTDAGTISYGLWKDSSSASSLSVDPLVQNVASAKKQAYSSGTIEDWGIAFEGLPLDSRLYPAVGLYQRDDRVTLLTVGENSGLLSGLADITSVTAGECFYPRSKFSSADADTMGSDRVVQIRSHNDWLSWDGIKYTAQVLEDVTNFLKEPKGGPTLTKILPSLTASLCLLPTSVPVLSARSAAVLMPHISRCMASLEVFFNRNKVGSSLFRNSIAEGKWTIRATGAGPNSSDVEEYVVDLKKKVDKSSHTVTIEGAGVGTVGKSKNGIVSIAGSIFGSSLTFAEEWSEGNQDGTARSKDDASSCVVTARMSLDGRQFEGTYRNVQYGTTGQIAGILPGVASDCLSKDVGQGKSMDTLRVCQSLLCMAHSHLASILGAAADFSIPDETDAEAKGGKDEKRRSTLASVLGMSVFSTAFAGLDSEPIQNLIDSVKLRFSPSVSTDIICGLRCDHLFVSTGLLDTDVTDVDPWGGFSRNQLEEVIADTDAEFARQTGGTGSLAGLCPDAHAITRRRLILVLLYLSGLYAELARSSPFEAIETESLDSFKSIWRTALKVVDDGIRTAISRQSTKTKRDQALNLCNRYLKTSDFFLGITKWPARFFSGKILDEFLDGIAAAYEAIEDENDFAYLRAEMLLSSKRAILRSKSLQEISDLISTFQRGSPVSLESISLALPHQLGRGRVPFRSMSHGRKCGMISDLDGNYLSGLLGASPRLKHNLSMQVVGLFEKLGNVLKNSIAGMKDGVFGDQSGHHSLILTILPLFGIQMRRDDFDKVVLKSGILITLPDVISMYRKGFLSGLSREDKEITDIHSTIQRDLCLAVLRCCTSVAHSLVYQATAFCPATVKTVSDSLTLLMNELALMFPLVERDAHLGLRELVKQNLDDDIKRLGDIQEGKMSSKKASHLTSRIRDRNLSGIEYLRLFGTSPKPLPRRLLSAQLATRPSFLSANFRTVALHELLSQLLHILCVVLRSPDALQIFASNGRWLVILFRVIGLDSTDNEVDNSISSISLRSHAEGILPAKFRARIVRFLFPLLCATGPNQDIVEGLFELAGVTSSIVTISLDEEETLISVECISLLRRLYSPSLGHWRDCVNRTIKAVTSPNSTEKNFNKKVGVLSFFGGNTRSICQGSYVVLKPKNASALTPEQASVSSPKSHSSAIGGSSGSAALGSAPHHVIGNGTDSVIAGLCSHEASAGIVSSIDMKNGLCEVILLPRRQECDHYGDSFSLDESIKAGNATGEKQNLTIRALRTPLSDTFLSQEVPIHLDETVPVAPILGQMLENSLSSLLSAVSPGSGRQAICRSEQNLSTKPKEEPAEEKQDTHAEEKQDENLEKVEQGQRVEVSHEETEAKSTNKNTKIDGQGVRSGVVGLACDILVIRCCIVALSNQQVLQSFMDHKTSPALLTLLSLAWPEPDETASSYDLIRDAREKPLSALALHESRLDHLLGLMRGIACRLQILKNTSDVDFNSILESCRPSQPSLADTVTDENKSEHQSEDAASSQTAHATNRSRRGGTDAGRESRSSTYRRSVSQSTGGSNSDDDDDENEAASTAAAHLREAAIAQMAELGLPRSWSELALRRVGGLNIEAAVTFCLECGGEMERLLAEERERERILQGGPGSSASRRVHHNNSPSNHLLRQLMEMGFPRRWCIEALAVTGNNVDEALTWILNNGERLSEEDEAIGAEEGDIDDGDDDSADDEDEDDADGGNGEAQNANDLGTETDTVEPANSWTGSVTPLRFISGRSIIDPNNLEISGLPNGGFSSVGTKGVMLTSGKWYYEAILETAGCLQIGWADGSFAGHCHADRGDGCGDGPSSWAYDGWRRYRWHSTATEWGCRWKEGDIVGCLVDMDDLTVSFTLNGEGDSIGMGLAFSGEGFRPCGGVYACVSFNRKEKLRLILGGEGSEAFKYAPPEGYRGVGEAILQAVAERDAILSKEEILGFPLLGAEDEPRPFLCDFSDGEHGHELMAWGHRYYGSDASVHLGAGGLKQTTGTSRGGASGEQHVPSCDFVSRRLEKALSTLKESSGTLIPCSIKSLNDGYEEVEKMLAFEIFSESLVLAILLSRKLILHSIVGMGPDFDPRSFGNEISSMRSLWRVLDVCSSLRSAGWAGEAGAMAIAAEALGLGISSNELQQKTSDETSGIVASFDLDSGLMLPVPGGNRLLDTVLLPETGISLQDPVSIILTAAEIALCSGGGGSVTSFILQGLQGAINRSPVFRKILVAAVRRAVRLLAAVEYDGDDAIQKGVSEDVDDIESQYRKGGEKAKQRIDTYFDQPDARLTAFLSGLLLSKATESSVEGFEDLQDDLGESWSLGLLSASIPWRTICACTVAGIINSRPCVLKKIVKSSATVARFFGRLPSSVARRVWAERAAVPVCSRYAQAMVELLASVKHAAEGLKDLPDDFAMYWSHFQVDAATPLPLDSSLDPQPTCSQSDWETEEGWASGDSGWIVWTGQVEYERVKWKAPPRSSVPSLMDGGDGPPMLDAGCTVVRGVDWGEEGSGRKSPDEDGKNLYDTEKSRRNEQLKSKKAQKTEEKESSLKSDGHEALEAQDAPGNADSFANPAEPSERVATAQERKDEEKAETEVEEKKLPSPKLPVGTVLGIEPWNGQPGLARRVRWHLTGEEGVYRFGGDGGRFDIAHVETNKKKTRIRKRHPLPETAEQCASRHGFGKKKIFPIILRLRSTPFSQKDKTTEGVLEWPDFGAGIRVSCRLRDDGSVVIKEDQLLFGSKDSGWEIRFGQPAFVAGTEFILTPSGSKVEESMTTSSFSSLYEELSGSNNFDVRALRNPLNGNRLKVSSKMRLWHTRNGPMPPPLSFDSEYHAPSLSLSLDGRTVSCATSDGKGCAFASVGFTKGVHYWEVKLEQADIGSVFIGVAEKPNGSGSGSSFGFDTTPRLNRWHGWGFVNFRATYTSGAERVYGAHCHAGDTIGVLLDCDAGRVSYFFDGLKYGEHILNDLGCAFENLSPFGFNVDGCGSGGAGQGAPNGFDGSRSGRYPSQGAVRPRALFPVVGLRSQGDRVTISSKWNTSYGVDGVTTVRSIVAVNDILSLYSESSSKKQELKLPDWFVRESYSEYQTWSKGTSVRTNSRGSGPFKLASFGLDLKLDSSPKACAAASASLGLNEALLSGDRVRLLRSAGRILELAEEALILGAYNGRLYYRIVSQKSEGGSLTEGGGRSWCLDESEVVDMLPFVRPGRAAGVPLPKLSRFQCPSSGGLKVVHEGGAVLRSDIEIFDGSMILGTIPAKSVLGKDSVLERRVNSCGVVRYRVRYEDLGEGWISARIRGGKEEPIVEPVISVSDNSSTDTAPEAYLTPEECADAWYRKWEEANQDESNFDVLTLGDFKKVLGEGVIPGLSTVDSDVIVASAVSCISNYTEGGDALECPFDIVASALSFALSSPIHKELSTDGIPACREAAAAVFSRFASRPSSLQAVLARVAVLRALNRRTRLVFPWLSIRPCQEGSAILGGQSGYGTSVERAGRSKFSQSQTTWVQVPGIGNKIRQLRGLFFTSVKQEFLLSVTEATTTPTPLSHDEYELPREIRTVRVNRLKAGRAMLSDDSSAKRKYSVFAQLQAETKSWGGAALRRGFIAKGHGGQKRAFRVKLIGEGVNDYSGPYREIFTDAISEATKTDANGRGSLGVLDPTPNNASGIGEDRELFMFSLNGRDMNPTQTIKSNDLPEALARIRQSFGFLTLPRDEASREVEESLVFLGRIVGTAFRHRISVDLPLPLHSVWKALAEEPSSAKDQLAELDYLAHRHLEDADDSTLLLWQQRMLNAFTEGLGNVLPVELLPLLTGEELRETVCGSPEVDVDLLRRVVEYEGYDETKDKVVEYFWDTLREMTNDERKQFLQFIWARNCLPSRESDFEAPFKIQKDALNEGAKADEALPSASTCFFSLTLPNYSSQDILRKKLLFAITNVTTMETDFQTNSAEIAEGYRTF